MDNLYPQAQLKTVNKFVTPPRLVLANSPFWFGRVASYLIVGIACLLCYAPLALSQP